MKRFILVLAVVFMAAIVFNSCKKQDDVVKPQVKEYVSAVAGSFVAKDGDITLKDAPIGANRTWTMYARNSSFYGNQDFALVRGLEFITGSVAYNFWSTIANNPVTFPASQSVYSNLTPDEDLRIICESKDAGNKVAYLGILDFKPSQVNFPLTVNCFRLGDVLTINTDQLTNLPGGDKLTFSVTYDLAPIDLATTELAAITGTGGVPNGKQFEWSDIKYGSSVSTKIAIGTGDFPVYEGLDSKVMGNIVITITDTYTGINNDQPVAVITLPTISAVGAGQGLKLTLHTNKIGWLDSTPITFTDTDITVTKETVEVN